MRLKEIVNTKLDGLQPVYWYDADEFKGRTMQVYSGASFEDMKLTMYSQIPDSLILCDFCNTKITEFPIPVFMDSYALCPKCFKSIRESDGQQY